MLSDPLLITGSVPITSTVAESSETVIAQVHLSALSCQFSMGSIGFPKEGMFPQFQDLPHSPLGRRD